MKTKTDSELIDDIVEYLYDNLSDAYMLGDGGSSIGHVLIELDRRFCGGANVKQLEQDLQDAEEFRKTEAAWIDRGK